MPSSLAQPRARVDVPDRGVIAWDTETALIRPGLLAPPLVCVTWAEPGKAPQIAHARDARGVIAGWLESGRRIVGHNVAFDFAVAASAYPDLIPLIFRAYDADLVTDTMIRQQLLDIRIGCYRGSVTAKGQRRSFEYTLEALAKRCAGIVLQKDGWRLSYAHFLETPLAGWPDRARAVQAEARPRVQALEAQIAEADAAKDKTRSKRLRAERDGLVEMINSDPIRCTSYPLDDAAATLAIYQAQERHAQHIGVQWHEARASLALYLNSAWGLRTDAGGVAKLRAAIEAEFADLDEDLQLAGLVRPDGTRDTKAAKRRMIEACRAEGIPVIRTDAHFEGEGLSAQEHAARGTKPRCYALDGSPLDDGADECAEHVCLDGDACDRSDDDVLVAYATRTTLGKQLTNDIPALEGGIVYPVHTRYGLAGTLRSTSSRPNIQNQSKREGFREAFTPRPGRVFAQNDFPTLELYCLAQACMTRLGRSRLAEALNSGLDPHLLMAASMCRLPYEDAKIAIKDATHPRHTEIKKARQLAKPANFGFPGGMGVKKFLASTRKAVIKADGRAAWQAMGLDEDRAEQLKAEWIEAWPEMSDYFAHVKESGPPYPERFEADVEIPIVGFVRGRATYCAACNTPFQGLGAACAKRACWLVARACYAEPSSPLYNSRPNAFVHDEIIVETDDAPTAHDAAQELARLMREGANAFLPDVPIPAAKTEPLLMRRWSKKAAPVFGTDGRLVPWAG